MREGTYLHYVSLCYERMIVVEHKRTHIMRPRSPWLSGAIGSVVRQQQLLSRTVGSEDTSRARYPNRSRLVLTRQLRATLTHRHTNTLSHTTGETQLCSQLRPPCRVYPATGLAWLLGSYKIRDIAKHRADKIVDSGIRHARPR